MYSGFIEINNSFLSNFKAEDQVVIKNAIYSHYLRCGTGKRIGRKIPIDDYFSSHHTKYKFIYFYCPKCKKSGVLVLRTPPFSPDQLKFCCSCGLSNPFYKYEIGKKKIILLLALSDAFKDTSASQIDYVLNQQIVTLIMSVLESFLRDIYVNILNAKFVESESSLFEKFIRDCKNDFMNPGKTNERFYKELGIHFKESIGRDVFKKLSDLAEYRNVIVHNAGICDQRFLDKRIGNHELYEQITIQTATVKMYFEAVEITVSKLAIIYNAIIYDCQINTLKRKLAISDSSALSIWLMPNQIAKKDE